MGLSNEKERTFAMFYGVHATLLEMTFEKEMR